jgi:2-iminobutanoate/2-iminopropanoate deaminase
MAMAKQAIQTNAAPAAIGPYSQAVSCDIPACMTPSRLIFLSGQIGIDPASQKLATGGVAAQARQIFKNIAAILQAAGSDLSQVVKVTVFLNDMGDFKTVNAIYADHFQEFYPARSAVAVKGLPLGAEIEIEVMAISSAG